MERNYVFHKSEISWFTLQWKTTLNTRLFLTVCNWVKWHSADVFSFFCESGPGFKSRQLLKFAFVITSSLVLNLETGWQNLSKWPFLALPFLQRFAISTVCVIHNLVKICMHCLSLNLFLQYRLPLSILQHCRVLKCVQLTHCFLIFNFPQFPSFPRPS